MTRARTHLFGALRGAGFGYSAIAALFNIDPSRVRNGVLLAGQRLGFEPEAAACVGDGQRRKMIESVDEEDEMLRYATGVFVVALLAACDNDSAYVTETDVQAAIKAGVPTCTPGRTVDCPCAGGMTGLQTCAHDGVSYGPCGDCSTPSTSSSTSSSGGGPATTKVFCDVNSMASASYTGMKAEALFGVRTILHNPQDVPPFHEGPAHYGDGVVTCACVGDFALFLGP